MGLVFHMAHIVGFDPGPCPFSIHKKYKMRFTDDEVLRKGLRILKFTYAEQDGKTEKWKQIMFYAAYGSPPKVINQIWNDLIDTDILEAKLDVCDKNHSGLRMLLIANYYLWAYPRSSKLLQMHFAPISEAETYGNGLWRWIEKMALMMPSRIHWLESLDDPAGFPFVVTVDGVDCKINEIRNDHPEFPFDPKLHSHKFKSAAWKYEIAVAIHSNNIVWVNGPWKGGRNDKTVLSEGQEEAQQMGIIDSLLQLVAPGKFIVCDRGYIKFSDPDYLEKVAFKHDDDDDDLKAFKGRVCARHETVNALLKEYQILSQTFRHSKQQHEMAFKAACYLVQCHFDMDVKFLIDSY